jgi:hypothetical protein
VTWPVAPDPTPIGAALDAHLKNVLSEIPTGRRGQATVALTTGGLEAGLGARGKVKGVDIAGAGWAAKAWGHGGWSAGARAAFTW